MFSFAIAWAGFVAIVLSAAFFWLLRSSGATQFSPSIQLGCIFIPNPRHPAADTIGFSLMLLLGTVVFPVIYAQIFAWTRGPSGTAGLAVGVLHGIAAAAALPVLGTISASVRAGTVPAPGPFGTKWGWLTPLALVVGHGLYGAVFGAILGNI